MIEELNSNPFVKMLQVIDLKKPNIVAPLMKQLVKGEVKKKRELRRKQIQDQPKIQLVSVKSHHINHIFAQSLKKNEQFDCKYKYAYPPNILNILYGQRIPLYNPYLKTLQKSQQLKNQEIKQAIKKVCLIGIGKEYLKGNKFRGSASYINVSLPIRYYMLDLIQKEINQKEDRNLIIIPISSTGMNYNYKNFPQKLSGTVTPKHFQQTINSVNQIISNQYLKYRSNSKIKSLSWTFSEKLSILLVMILFIVFLKTGASILLILILIVIVLGSGAASMECMWKLNSLEIIKNTNARISHQINNYFTQIYSQGFQWRVGKDYYWLEIHKKKRIKKLQPIFTLTPQIIGAHIRTKSLNN